MQPRLRAGIAAAVLLFPTSGWAQKPTQAQANAIRQLCRTDYQMRCAGVPSGGSAALACLEQNAASLSAPCQQALAAATPAQVPSSGAAQPAPAPAPAARGENQAAAPPPSRRQVAMMRRACGADFLAFCSDIEPGGGRGLACLIAHRPELSSSCRNALSEARQAR